MTVSITHNFVSPLVDANGTNVVGPNRWNEDHVLAGTLDLSNLEEGTDGQLIVGQTSSSPLYKTVSGDATLANTGALTVASIGGVALNFGAWTAYTPTITSNTGTVTGETITKATRYKTLGKTTFVEGRITLTDIGSGTPGGFVGVSLPNTAQSIGFTSGMLADARAATGYIAASAAHIEFYLYSGATLWTNGNVIYFSGVYENQ